MAHELRSDRRAVARGETTLDPLDAHAGLMSLNVAAQGRVVRATRARPRTPTSGACTPGRANREAVETVASPHPSSRPLDGAPSEPHEFDASGAPVCSHDEVMTPTVDSTGFVRLGDVLEVIVAEDAQPRCV